MIALLSEYFLHNMVYIMSKSEYLGKDELILFYK